MANGEQIIDLAMTAEGVDAVNSKLMDLQMTVIGFRNEIKQAFVQESVTKSFKVLTVSSRELEKALLVLRLNLGKLKSALTDAVAPVGTILIQQINQAVLGAIRMVKTVAQVISALFGGSKAGEAYGKATEKASQAQTALTKSSGKLKRTLMGFDEINRLSSGSGSSGGTESIVNLEEMEYTLSPKLQEIVDKILSIVAPLKRIDFSDAQAAFGRLQEAIGSIGRALFAGLEWAWQHLLGPLAAWTIEDVLPAFLEVLSGGLQVLNAVITALKPAADWLWENFLKPLGQWTGEKIIVALGWLRERLDGISLWISEHQALVQRIGLVVAGVAAAIGLANKVLGEWNGLSGAAIGLTGGFGNAVGFLANPISLVSGGVKALAGAVLLLITNWDSVKTTAVSVWEAIQSAWSGVGSWFRLHILDPLQNGFKNMSNGIIGFLNGLISGVAAAVNGVVNAINRLQFTVPNWIPGLGGKKLGFQLRTVSMPQIPYLAQGAVLPANKPFMAVVGDQRHGTNVEAPLATIQEAVALVTGEQTTAILAGFEASVGVQREILQAVLGIQIGDEVIGQAVSRYQRKMAVVRGG